ncbi:hypothetical protein ACWDX9_63310, partial [Nonomuraea sp. NPDC003201]
RGRAVVAGRSWPGGRGRAVVAERSWPSAGGRALVAGLAGLSYDAYSLVGGKPIARGHPSGAVTGAMFGAAALLVLLVLLGSGTQWPAGLRGGAGRRGRAVADGAGPRARTVAGGAGPRG